MFADCLRSEPVSGLRLPPCAEWSIELVGCEGYLTESKIKLLFSLHS